MTSPARVQITSLATPATVSISEPGYGGTYTTNAAACAGIASIVPAVTPGSFTITGIAPGQCAISFTDSFSQSVALPVSVTASAIVAQ